ncbi:hypothetical protein BVG19_g4296 [[Candida] boidinii]|nr:hypothetical protein BVG19_g4296 [[Candida] boidinii]OWB51285.1 hypothetical protein B5S27_g2845 [[Candida] boidinii]
MISFLNNNFTNLKINDKEKFIISEFQPLNNITNTTANTITTTTTTKTNNSKVDLSYHTNNKILDSKYSNQDLNHPLESQVQSQLQSQSINTTDTNKVPELTLPDQQSDHSLGSLDITEHTQLPLNSNQEQPQEEVEGNGGEESSCNLLDLLKDSDQLGNILDTSHLFNSFNSFELIDIFNDNQAIVKDQPTTEQAYNHPDQHRVLPTPPPQSHQSSIHPEPVTASIARPPRDNINFDYKSAFNSHKLGNSSISDSISLTDSTERDKDFESLIIKKNSLNSINKLTPNLSNSSCNIEDNQSIPSSLIYNYNLANLYTNLGTPNIKKRKDYYIINTNNSYYNKIQKKLSRKKSINSSKSNSKIINPLPDTSDTTTNTTNNNNTKDEQRIEDNYDKHINDNDIIYNTNNNINKVKYLKYFKRWEWKKLKFLKKKPVNTGNELAMETKSLNAIINTSNTTNSFKIIKKNFTNIYYSLTNRFSTKLKEEQEQQSNCEFNESKDESIDNTNENETQKFQLIFKFDDHLKSLRDLFINNEDTIDIDTSKLRSENDLNLNDLNNDNNDNHSEFSFQRTAYSDFSPLITKN